MIRKIATLIIKIRILILAVILVLTGFWVYKLKDLNLEQDLSDIIPPNHPYTQVDKKFFEIFGGSNLVAIAMKVKQGEITDYENLAKVYRITEGLDGIPDIVMYRIVSIASQKMRLIEVTYDPNFPDLPTIENTGFFSIVQDILREKDENRRLSFRKNAILNNPAVLGTFVSKDLKGTVILCDFWGDKRYKEIYSGIKKLVEQEQDENTSFYLGGRPILLGYLAEYMRGMVSLFGAGVLTILILLLIMFRGWRGIVLPFVAGLITIIWVLGCVAFFKIRMDMMSITVPFLIFAILVGHSVQILNRYYEEVLRERDNKIAAINTIEAIAIPGLGAILTDMLGFLCLALYPFRIIRGMALMGSIGILLTFLFVTIMFPCILSLLPLPSSRELDRVERPGAIVKAIAAGTQSVIGKRFRYVVFITGLIIMVIFGFGARKIVVGDPQEGSPYFFQDSKYNQDEYVLNHEFLGTNPLYILFETKKRFGIESVRLATYIDQFSARLKQLPEVRYVSSYVDILKSLNFYWYEMKPEYFCIPNTDTGIGLYLYSYVQSVEPEVTRPYFDVAQQWVNIQVIIKDHQTATIDKVLNFIKQDVETIGKPSVGDICNIYVAGGIIANYASIIEEIKGKSNYILLLITIADLIFCIIVFRSITIAILILFPLFIGVLVTNGIMGYLNIGLFLYTIPIASLGMGLGVDYAIYTTSRWTEEYKKRGNRDEALKAMTYGAGKAVMFTAFSVALGAFVLIFSGLRFQVIMGALLGIVILIDMLGALFVLPAVFGVFRVKRFSSK